MNIYLVRHGKDYDDYRGGWSDLGLIEEGIQQAKLLGNHLHKNREKFKIDTLISSDLRRTVETTEGIQLNFDIPSQFSSDWREINNGELAGMLNSVALKKYPGLFFNTLRMDEQYPGGESPLEFYNRIKKSFDDLCTKIINGETGPNVLLVTHGGVIDVLYHIINGVEWTNKSKALCKTTNTGMHIITYTPEGWKIIESNNVDHLK